MNCLVIPSNRESHLKDFLEHWGKPWDHIIVIEDNPEKTFNIDLEHHYSWKEIDDDLKEDSWIISRKDSAIRSYGFLVAYRLGADYVFTLDDDCLREDDILEHITRMEQTPVWTESVPGQRTRGMPYHNTGVLKNVVASMGLWTGIPDHDAIQTLSKQPFTLPEHINRIMPIGQYFPLCGMNFAFKREVAVLTYFPLMETFKRFDDIWFGIIFKKICDHLRIFISCGHPLVRHSRASNPFVNLVREAPGISYNEGFWGVIDAIQLKGTTPKQCMKEVGAVLKLSEDAYLARLGQAILLWAKYFE